MASDPNKVICRGDGLKFGYINEPIHATIDTRQAGSGELTVYCQGPSRKAFCDLKDHHDGTFTLVIRAQDIGEHLLHIQYDGVDVPGSPFKLRVSPANLVRISGPGLADRLLSSRTGDQITIDTENAGKGEVRVRIGGPRGAFQLRTQKEGKRVQCRYDPRANGIYVVNILWNEDHIPGSPFQVFLALNEEDLANYRSSQSRV